MEVGISRKKYKKQSQGEFITPVEEKDIELRDKGAITCSLKLNSKSVVLSDDGLYNVVAAESVAQSIETAGPLLHFSTAGDTITFLTTFLV